MAEEDQAAAGLAEVGEEEAGKVAAEKAAAAEMAPAAAGLAKAAAVDSAAAAMEGETDLAAEDWEAEGSAVAAKVSAATAEAERVG